jgi:glycine cleavage system aminomethyltransferase T
MRIGQGNPLDRCSVSGVGERLEAIGQHTTVPDGSADRVLIPATAITSGTRLPILRRNIALCRMAIEYSEIGTKVGVGRLDGHPKRIPAQVVRFLFYDPDKTSPVLTSHSARNGPSLRAAEVAC